MQTTISLRAPSIGAAPELAVGFVDSVAALAKLAHDDAEAIRTAAHRLVGFALEHSYPPGTEGEIAVEAHLFDGGIRVDVHDWGLPLELERARVEQGEHDASPLEVPGLDLDGLVDEASFHSLGRDGKLFSVVRHCTHDSPVASAAPLLADHDDQEPAAGAARPDVVVRRFEPGDEEGICQLVYRNYANTYGSEFFYVPEKLLQRNRDGEVVSQVALVDGEIVGHHALLREGSGLLAETGAAVIHPDYKGLGIYNSLSLQTLQDARDLRLSVLYAQAVTIHPYSQKGAHTHGYRETAIALGRARASIRLEGNELTRTGKRHAIVVVHLCYDHSPRRVFLPDIYRDRLLSAYEDVGLEVAGAGEASVDGEITAELDAGLNIGTVVVGRWEPGDERALAHAFHYLLAKHCDMVYADVDLGRVARVDEAVEHLNRTGFFYSGLMVLGRGGRDQLRLQYENTLEVDEDEIVCYSDAARNLKEFVLADEKRVGEL